MQTAIAALVGIRYAFPPPRTQLAGIIIFFVLMITGTLTFLDGRKLTPLLQFVSVLGMLACLSVIFTLRPFGEILIDALGGGPGLRTVFARAALVLLRFSPFNIVWLIEDMAYSRHGHGFPYHLHAVAGFVFWLVNLLVVSAGKRRGTEKLEMPSSTGVYREPVWSADLAAQTSGRLKRLRVFFNQRLLGRLADLEKQRKIVKSKMLQNHVYFGLTTAGCFVFGWHAAMGMLANERGFGFPFLMIMILWVVALSFYWPYRCHHDKKDYVQGFKKEIIEQLVGFVDPSLRYEPERKIDLEHFIRGDIYRTTPSIYTGDDYVSGVVNVGPSPFVNSTYKNAWGAITSRYSRDCIS